MKNKYSIDQQAVAENTTDSHLPARIDRSTFVSNILNKDLTTAEDLAKHYAISIEQAKRILSEPDFVKAMQEIEKGYAKVQFYITVPARLLEMIKNEKPRTAIMASKVLANILGEAEGKPLIKNVHNEQNNYYEAYIEQLSERKRLQAAEKLRKSESQVDAIDAEIESEDLE